MNRKIYIANQDLSLAEYCPAIDSNDYYACWQDPDTQNGYNHQISSSPEEFLSRPIRFRFLAVILRNQDSEPLGIVSLSPESSLPDLAIMLYRPYRGKGYGTDAFALAAKYCLETFHLEFLYAGCYETNTASLKMLKACGFTLLPTLLSSFISSNIRLRSSSTLPHCTTAGASPCRCTGSIFTLRCIFWANSMISQVER